MDRIRKQWKQTFPDVLLAGILFVLLLFTLSESEALPVYPDEGHKLLEYSSVSLQPGEFPAEFGTDTSKTIVCHLSLALLPPQLSEIVHVCFVHA